MYRFLTVTLNPALDLSTEVERVIDAHKMRCASPVVHPGGGGINVARVLHRQGADVAAFYPVGGATGERLSQLVVGEGVPSLYQPIAGETRESFTVRESATGHEFRFVLPGPTLSQAEWRACLQRLLELPALPRWLVASGSLPPGVPDDFYARLARLARERGSRFVLDASGAPLAAALAEGVWAVKPSLRELQDLTGQSLGTQTARLAAARGLVDAGQARLVALSLGREGALLVTADTALVARAVSVPVVGTVGAGDSFLAGLLGSLERDPDPVAAFREAMAAAAAALLCEGTALARPEDIERLRASVVIEQA